MMGKSGGTFAAHSGRETTRTDAELQGSDVHQQAPAAMPFHYESAALPTELLALTNDNVTGCENARTTKSDSSGAEAGGVLSRRGIAQRVRQEGPRGLTVERLRQLVQYDALTGVFVNNGQRGKCAEGAVVGVLHPRGYLFCMLDRHNYSLHRLAWMYVHEEWPAGFLDHINRDRSDNRIANLRRATASQNHWNSERVRDAKGYMQYGPDTFYMQLRYNGTRINRTFRTAEEATAFYRQTSAALHGEFVPQALAAA